MSTPPVEQRIDAAAPTPHAAEVAWSVSRGERWFVCLFLLISVGLPPLMLEAFPFSTCSMFAVPYHERRFYELTDARGKKLNADIYGLRANPNWYLEHTYGVKYPPSLVVPTYDEPDMERVVDHIQAVAAERQAALPLRLKRWVVGPVDDFAIGVIDVDEWVIADDR